MNLSDVYAFKKVAATLSFAQAARQIGVSRSAVSKQVSRLERNLGVVLVHRTTRSVNLTEAGRIFDANTGEIDTMIEHAVDLARGADHNPLGTVSFSLPSALGAALMPSLTTDFQERWPELKLNIHFDDQPRDLIKDNLDLAICISQKLTDSSLISRRLGSTQMVLAASPGYLERYGVPENPSDLERHRCLGRGSAVKSGANWRLLSDEDMVDVPTPFALSANNDLAAILAACNDAGIVNVPEICIRRELARGELRVIPGLLNPEPYGVFAIYPHRNAAAKVKVLADYIETLLPDVTTIDRCFSPSDNDDSADEPSNVTPLTRDTTRSA